ncbi:hypothetical protein BJ944DRAFT_272436 [Cunninghamella echinulata]|nr:hypothetical protein BJ944DRAFT_272436 [Cunninghamella echinulata]
MKVSLFVISTVALCLLQQTQARPSPLDNEVTNGATDGTTSEVTNTATGALRNLGIGSTLVSDVDNPVKLSETAKREAPVEINSTVNKLLEKVDGLKGDTGSSSLLNITKVLGLDKLLGGLVGTVRSLFKKGDLVDGLLETVTDLLDTLLKLLKSLGLGDIVDLSALEELVNELFKAAGVISKRDIAPDVAGGTLKKINIDAVKGLLEEVQAALDEAGLGAILEPILDIVNCLLGGIVNGEGTKAGALRRALIKRAIERRAAL